MNTSIINYDCLLNVFAINVLFFDMHWYIVNVYLSLIAVSRRLLQKKKIKKLSEDILKYLIFVQVLFIFYIHSRTLSDEFSMRKVQNKLIKKKKKQM